MRSKGTCLLSKVLTPPALMIVRRCQWADHFDKQGVRYAFFSAKAAALQQASVEQSIAQQPETTPNEEPTSVVGEHENNGVDDQELASPTSEESGSESEGEFGDFDRSSEDLDPRAKILSVRELEELFLETGPDLSCESDHSYSLSVV